MEAEATHASRVRQELKRDIHSFSLQLTSEELEKKRRRRQQNRDAARRCRRRKRACRDNLLKVVTI